VARLIVRILLLDDDTDFVQHLLIARPADVAVAVSHGTLDVFGLLRTEELDVVVLDLAMPLVLAASGQDEGLAVLGAIVGGHRGRVPVVVVTESADADAEAWCRRLGAFAVLRKADGLAQVFEAARAAVAGNSPLGNPMVSRHHGRHCSRPSGSGEEV